MKRADLQYLTALLLFGSNGIVASRIALNSDEIVLLRTLIGSLLLITVFLGRHGKLTCCRSRKQLFLLCGSGAAMGAGWLFLYEAYAQIGVSIASLLYYCGPVLVMALSPLLFRERLGASSLAGFFCVFCGALLVNGNAFAGGGNRFGLFCGAMSAVMYAAMVICSKKASAAAGLEPPMLQLTVSCLTVAAFVGLKQGLAVRIAPSSLLPVLILGLLNTGVGCCLYFSALGRLPIQTVAVCGYLEPLSAVLFSTVILREAMRPLQIAGAALMLGGAMLAECRPVRRNRQRTL